MLHCYTLGLSTSKWRLQQKHFDIYTWTKLASKHLTVWDFKLWIKTLLDIVQQGAAVYIKNTINQLLLAFSESRDTNALHWENA